MVDLSCVANRSLALARTKMSDYDTAVMIELVSIARTQGNGQLDYATGLVKVQSQVIYTGKAWLGIANPAAGADDQEERSFTESFPVKLPSDAPLIKVDDVLTVTTPNTWLTGRSYWVAGVSRNGLGPLVQRLTVIGVAPSRTNQA